MYRSQWTWKESTWKLLSIPSIFNLPGCSETKTMWASRWTEQSHQQWCGKLIHACNLWEAIFPSWISNPIMVKIQDGSWRMCIDYTNLNKACLKDCYPFSELDQKVESMEGFKWKCFLDAYKGYHQILWGENCILHGPWYILLQENDFRTQKYRGDIPTPHG